MEYISPIIQGEIKPYDEQAAMAFSNGVSRAYKQLRAFLDEQSGYNPVFEEQG